MADDFVRDIPPLSQINPVRPSPSNIRQERRRRRRDRDTTDEREGGRRGPDTIEDKISISQAPDGSDTGRSDPDKVHREKRSDTSSSDPVKRIDIRI